MQEAVKLMAAICLVPPDGHEKTLEAITIAGEMKGAGGAGGGERFGPIVQGLLVGNEQLRTNCMTLINAIITSPDDLDFRMHLRNEFLREGLLDVLDVSIIFLTICALFFLIFYTYFVEKRKDVVKCHIHTYSDICDCNYIRQNPLKKAKYGLKPY